ncbi:hypothetical protein ANO14919_074520 [Xylariales sp. No.14919]|nr:hypothetical protein ANO14919_074520 [Xylariales sp. No.14919]
MSADSAGGTAIRIARGFIVQRAIAALMLVEERLDGVGLKREGHE